MKYRVLSTGQKALLVIVWIVAIYAVIFLGQSIHPSEQALASSQIKTLAPIAFAFLFTIFITVNPTGRVRHLEFGAACDPLTQDADATDIKSTAWRFRATVFVLIGMVWVSSITLMLLGAERIYAEMFIRPLCETHLDDYPNVNFKGAKILTGEDRFGSFFGTYHPIECRFDKLKAVNLDQIIGSKAEFVTHLLSDVIIIALSLIGWGAPTLLLGWKLFRRFKPRNN